jgi:hypothetical protein
VSFSVPEGSYSYEFSVLTGSATDTSVAMALVVKPEFTVTSDMTITADARTSTQYQPTLDEPVTRASQIDFLTFNRAAETGGGFKIQAFGIDGAFAIAALHLNSIHERGYPPLRATPTAPVTKGALNFSALTVLADSDSATGPSVNPRYYFVFPSPAGIPSSLTYRVPTAQLTTVHSHVYNTACAGTCAAKVALFSDVFLPWSVNELGWGGTVLAGDRTDYWYSSMPESTIWQTALNTNDGDRHFGPRRLIAPGQQLDETWNKAPITIPSAAPYDEVPLAVGTSGPMTSSQQQVCVACRQDDNAFLYLVRSGDTDPTHFGFETPSSSVLKSTFRFTRNGELAASNSSGGVAPFSINMTLLPDPATYQLDWTMQQHKGDPVATTRTVWTLHSSRADAVSAPTGLQCAPDRERTCSFLPLLFVHYDLGVDVNSKAPAGAAFPVTFSLSGQQYAPAPSQVTATVSASYDDGHTWTAAQPAQAGPGGQFTATIDHPELTATSGFVSLRVRARDTAGNAVDQTTIRAYGLS